ncbi:unnamed protein product [Trichobilharzia szidati]|nr:unnamed protein product [Trichobilharzia szidati]
MVDKKAAVNSVLISREFEVLDKFQKRVLVFLAAICPITLVITPALPFINKRRYPVSTAISYILLCVYQTTN